MPVLCIGICDDNYDARLALRGTLERVLEPQGETARILEFSSGEGLLNWKANHPGGAEPDFFGHGNGPAGRHGNRRRLRQGDEDLQLVFVTGYADYVFDGYRVGALGYLLKPPRPSSCKRFWPAQRLPVSREEAVYLCRSGEVTIGFRGRKSSISPRTGGR